MILPLLDIRAKTPRIHSGSRETDPVNSFRAPRISFDDRKNTGVHKMSAGRFDWMWQKRFYLIPLNDDLETFSSFSFKGWGLHFVWPKGFGLT